jgi:hypothetical protein
LNDQQNGGVVQHGLGFVCLACGKYFYNDPTEPRWTHPDLWDGIYPVACPNNGKTFKVPVLEEVAE